MSQNNNIGKSHPRREKEEVKKEIEIPGNNPKTEF